MKQLSSAPDARQEQHLCSQQLLSLEELLQVEQLEARRSHANGQREYAKPGNARVGFLYAAWEGGRHAVWGHCHTDTAAVLGCHSAHILDSQRNHP